jgi:hypothetical protein
MTLARVICRNYLEAARCGHVQCVARCVAAGADLDAATEEENMTAVMFAAQVGRCRLALG